MRATRGERSSEARAVIKLYSTVYRSSLGRATRAGTLEGRWDRTSTLRIVFNQRREGSASPSAEDRMSTWTRAGCWMSLTGGGARGEPGRRGARSAPPVSPREGGGEGRGEITSRHDSDSCRCLLSYSYVTTRSDGRESASCVVVGGGGGRSLTGRRSPRRPRLGARERRPRSWTSYRRVCSPTTE